MNNPYQPSTTSADAALSSGFSLRALLLSQLMAFAISILLAGMAGIFIAFFAAALSDANGDTTLVFDAIFFPVFVWLPYLLCGYFAGRIAGFRHIFHGLCGGCIYLVGNIAMSLPLDSGDPYFWSHMISFALIIPLAFLGGKLSKHL